MNVCATSKVAPATPTKFPSRITNLSGPASCGRTDGCPERAHHREPHSLVKRAAIIASLHPEEENAPSITRPRNTKDDRQRWEETRRLRKHPASPNTSFVTGVVISNHGVLRCANVCQQSRAPSHRSRLAETPAPPPRVVMVGVHGNYTSSSRTSQYFHGRRDSTSASDCDFVELKASLIVPTVRSRVGAPAVVRR
jgi:hypothetical protein